MAEKNNKRPTDINQNKFQHNLKKNSYKQKNIENPMQKNIHEDLSYQHEKEQNIWNSFNQTSDTGTTPNITKNEYVPKDTVVRQNTSKNQSEPVNSDSNSHEINYKPTTEIVEDTPLQPFIAQDFSGIFEAKNNATGDIKFEAAYQTGQYATKDIKTNENTVYENQQRTSKVVNIMSIVTSDYAQTKELDRFKSIENRILEDDSFKNDLKELGFGNTEYTSRFSEMMGSHRFEATVYEADGSQSFVSVDSLGGLSQKELNSIEHLGKFTRTDENGIMREYVINREYVAGPSQEVLNARISADLLKDSNATMSNEDFATLFKGGKLRQETEFTDIKEFSLSVAVENKDTGVKTLFKTSDDVRYEFLRGGALTDIEKEALKNTGVLTRTLQDGSKQEFKLKTNITELKVQNVDTSKIVRNARIEQTKNEKIFHTTNNSEKLEAMKTLRSASLNRMKESGIEIGKGTLAELSEQRKIINADLYNKKIELSAIQKQIDYIAFSSTLTEIDKNKTLLHLNSQLEELETDITKFTGQLTQLDKHMEIMGESVNSGHQGRKSAGISSIRNKIAGQDMMTGYQTSRNVLNASQMGVKLAVRSTDNLTNKAAKDILKKANISMDSDNFLAKAVRKQDKRIQNRKDYAEAKKAGKDTLNQFKDNKRIEKINSSKALKREDRLQNKAQKLRANGNEKRAIKLENKRQRSLNLREKKTSRVKEKTGFKNNIKKKFNNWTTKVSNNKVVKLFRKVGEVGDKFVDALKGILKKYIIVPIGALLIVVVIITVIIEIISYAMYFLSEVPATNLTGGLDNINYIQIIVDDTAQTLGNSLQEVAERDAKTHYLDIDNGHAIPSNYTGWYKEPTDGTIGRIVKTENTSQNSCGLNENLLPITSIMHMRYQDEIDFLNWHTAHAYVYYMYVQTHHVYHYVPYEARDINDCDNLYENNADVYYGYTAEGKGVLTRPNESCTNVYIHGYNTDLNKEVNKIRLKVFGVLDSALSLIGVEMNEEYNGIFTTPIEGCNDFLVCARSLAEEDAICGYDYHQHTYSCYQLSCGKEAHVHGDGNCSCTQPVQQHDWQCSKQYDCHVCGMVTTNVTEITEHYHNNPGHWGGWNYTCGHHTGHNSNCCSKEQHIHELEPPTNHTSFSDSVYDNDPNDTVHGCYSPTACGKPAHQHTPWSKDPVTQVVNPGCFETIYICKGHCGGHFTPVVNMQVDTSFEYIAKHDYFKTPYFLSSADFGTIGSYAVNLKANNIEEWKGLWDAQMLQWFKPYPTSPTYIFEELGKRIIYGGASFIDAVSQRIKAFFDPTRTYAEIRDEIKAQAEAYRDTEDLFDFTGWYNEDGTLKEDLMEELRDIYGTHTDDYATGKEAWEDFDVLFPIGGCRPLSSDQKTKILEQLNLPDGKRKKVIEQAMDYVGQFWYDLSVNTGNMYSTSGRIDCSGFVSSVLYHADIGWINDWSSMTFASNGSTYSASMLQPGDILAKSRTSGWTASNGWGNGTSNHVIIYLGYLPEGVPGYDEYDGAGTYIIDCSSSKNGSTVRKVGSATLVDNYPYRFTNY